MRTTTFTFLATLLLASCGTGQAPTTHDATAATDTVPSTPAPEPLPDLVLPKVEPAAVLQALFAGTLTGTGRAIDVPVPDVERNSMQWPEGSVYRTSVEKVLPAGAKKDRMVVVMATNTVTNGVIADCRACAPDLGLAVFAKEPEGWRLKGFARSLGAPGSNGRLWPYDLVKAGAERQLFRVKGAYGMGGQETRSEFLYSLAEEDERIQQVLEVGTLDQYTDDMTDATTGQRTTWKLAGGGQAYDDIVTTSREFGPGSAGKVPGIAIYRYDPVSGTFVTRQ